jgi:predicted CopG family antitoxin
VNRGERSVDDLAAQLVEQRRGNHRYADRAVDNFPTALRRKTANFSSAKAADYVIVDKPNRLYERVANLWSNESEASFSEVLAQGA